MIKFLYVVALSPALPVLPLLLWGIREGAVLQEGKWPLPAQPCGPGPHQPPTAPWFRVWAEARPLQSSDTSKRSRECLTPDTDTAWAAQGPPASRFHGRMACVPCPGEKGLQTPRDQGCLISARFLEDSGGPRPEEASTVGGRRGSCRPKGRRMLAKRMLASGAAVPLKATWISTDL